MKDKITVEEYRKIKNEKVKNVKHYSHKDLYESEYEKRFTDFDMVDFANYVNSSMKRTEGRSVDYIQIGIAELREFEKIKTSKLK